MKFQNVVLSGVVLAVAFVACGVPTESGNSNLVQEPITDAGAPPSTDAGIGAPTDAGTPQDAGPAQDAGQPMDAGTENGCKQIATHAAVNVIGEYDEEYDVAYSTVEDSSTEPLNVLLLEAYDLSSIPFTAEFDKYLNYQTCMTCVIYMENCAGDTCDRFYLAQGGEVAIQSVTPAASGGALNATGQDLKLVEWDFESDTPMPGGACIQLGSADFSATW